MRVKSTSDGHSAVLDDLVGKRDRAELFNHIATLAKEKCPKSNALLIAATLGAAAGLAAVLLSWSFRAVARWQAMYPATFLIATGMFGAVLSMAVDVGMPGLQQRAFLFLLLFWLCIVVQRLVRVTAALVQTLSTAGRHHADGRRDGAQARRRGCTGPTCSVAPA